MLANLVQNNGNMFHRSKDYIYQTMAVCLLQWRHNGREGVRLSASPLFTQPFIQVQIEENIKAPRHWPLCGEFTGDRWIPRTNDQ